MSGIGLDLQNNTIQNKAIQRRVGPEKVDASLVWTAVLPLYIRYLSGFLQNSIPDWLIKKQATSPPIDYNIAMGVCLNGGIVIVMW